MKTGKTLFCHGVSTLTEISYYNSRDFTTYNIMCDRNIRPT